jgi:ribonuclease VapC
VNRVVLDSSAVLAMILKEPGGDRVESLLDRLDAGSRRIHIAISAVNWCEILTRLERAELAMTGERLASILSGVEVQPFGKTEAEVSAKYARLDASLSIGDRACIALAAQRRAVAWTTDKIWARVSLPVKVEFLR